MPCSPSQIKVLIVDDCMEDQETCRRLLHDSRGLFTVTAAPDGEEALACCARQLPDCVLLDYRLPDMDGIEFMELLAACNFIVPVIMLTGHGHERIAVRAMKAGARDYLVKGHLNWAALSSAIGEAIVNFAPPTSSVSC